MKGLKRNLRSNNRLVGLVLVSGLYCKGGNLPVCAVLIWLNDAAWRCAITAASVALGAP